MKKNTELALQMIVAGYSATAVVLPAYAADPLPMPCAAGACGPTGPSTWVTSGTANAVYQNNSLTINQASQNAILNWRSFNIAPDGTVEFKQPDATAVALNRIYQADASRIFGNLKANGRIYLVNQNGMLFGDGAKVNVGALVASTLDIPTEVLERGLTGGASLPAATRFVDPQTGQSMESAPLQIQNGALLQSDGGQIFLFAPVVENKGRIETPDGQTVLAAGQSVYLSASSDQNLRGLIVAVDLEGTVDNGDTSNASVTDPSKLVGQIIAERGNVTLAGLTVNQHGRVSANTSVRANGSVHLIAANSTTGGTLTIGRSSRTEVTLDSSDESRTVDVNQQPQSRVLLAGNRITVEQNAAVVAPSGQIRIKASAEGSDSVRNPPSLADDADARVLIEDGAVLDVSGVHTTQSMESNMLAVELRGSQLADSPNQRNGSLRGQRVQIDTRRNGTREDGSTWVGSPIGDLNGDVATMSRNIAQRSLAGGRVEIESQGDVIVAQGATVNVSGGSVRYDDGYITPSSLLGADGRVYDMADADPNRDYVSVLSGSSYVRRHARWGVTDQYYGTFAGNRGQFEQGYIEGKDAGTLSLLAPSVIFDGRLQADRVIGPHQRLAAASVFDTLYRPFDQIPVGGQLLLDPAVDGGSPYVLGNVAIDRGLVLPTLRNSDGSAFDPTSDVLPESLTATRIRPELFGEGAATRVAIRSDGSITVADQTRLDMPAGSTLSLTGRDVDFGGSFSSAGGRVMLRANRTTTQQDFGQGELHLRETARLDVAGSWVNESVRVNAGRATEALAVDGGTVELQGVDSNVIVEAGSVIDVSGGARMTRDGSVTAGRGGAIEVGASTSPTFAGNSASLTVDGDLRGYALETGASLSLTAPHVCIAATSLLCGDDLSDELFLIEPERFRSGGFASYAVTSSVGGVTVGRGTRIGLQSENMVLNDNAAASASARSLAGLASVSLIDSSLRGPVDLALRTDALQPAGTRLSALEFAGLAPLSILEGAGIVSDPGARISLESNTSIHVHGRIEAPAGRISLALDNSLDLAEYAPTQSIWLGSDASLSAAGTVRYQASQQGLLVGEVLAGGDIRMDAARGYIAANPGSVLDVSGIASDMDIRSVQTSGIESYQRQTIASRGGSMNFVAAEGIFLSGDLRARSGDPTTLIGGALSMTLDASRRYADIDPLQMPLYSETARRIEIAPTANAVALGAAAPLDMESTGRAVISVAQIEQAGFDHLHVESRTRMGGLGPLEPLPGEVVVRDGVDLNLRGMLSIDSASVRSEGGSSRLAATTVTLGQQSTILQDVPTDLRPGNGELVIEGQLLDLVGHTVLDGFASVALRSKGDIRARGIQLGSERAAEGSLRTTGTLSLEAQQIYPTTLAQFELIADEPGTGAISIAGVEGTAAPVYSAGGALTLRANSIDQGGVLRAPFGTISLEAPDLHLRAGSITATSAAGLAIPFGETQGGFDWVYQLGNQTLVYDGVDEVLPGQAVKLNGAQVAIEEGATVDVRGGGDMIAYEFVPGVGGTRDVLSAQVRDDAFVIVPTANLRFAPHDSALYQGSTIYPGDSVHLYGAAGIPEGTYAILPARYAHLPGAWYVRSVPGYQDIGRNESNRRLDGSTLVGGYFTFADTGLRIEGRSTAFAVRPGSEIMREAQYNLTSANRFFGAMANDAEAVAARLPRDAGTLSIAAGEVLRLDGDLRGSAATDGRGSALDISSERLRIVGTGSVVPVEGVVDIDATSLSQFGAESILLGGSRTQTGDGLSIVTQARELEVSEGAVLSAPELLLVATENLAVRSGSELRAEGTALASMAASLSMQGDGAAVRVTTGRNVAIERDVIGGVAALTLEQGSRLTARGGTVAAESAGTTRFAPTLDVQGGVLSLTGDRVALGATDDLDSGLLLSNAQLAGLSVDELVLSSRTSIDFHGPLTLRAGDLSLRSGALRGFGEGTATIAATGTLTLEGASPVSAESSGSGLGTLRLDASNIVLGTGESQISGFESVAMLGGNDITLRGTGSLNIAADTTLSAARLTADSGATRSLRVQGSFAYAAAAATAQSIATDLGARVDIEADSILFDGRADLQSGVLRMFALSGDVSLGSAADVRLNGVTTAFDSVPVGSRGGWLDLGSTQGNVSIAESARIDVSSASDAQSDRGSIAIAAAQGRADVRGEIRGAGADFSVDAADIDDFASLNARLLTGGFTGDRRVRQRGPGDLVVSAGASADIDARSVHLIADQGSVVVGGVIRSHTDGGGRIILAGRDGVIVNGTLNASAADSSERNGRIELGTTEGSVRIASTARIIGASSAGRDHSFADGTFHVRAPRSVLATLADNDAANDAVVLGGEMSQLNAITLEGYAAYGDADITADGVISADEVVAAPGSLMYDEAFAFTGLDAQILKGLGTIRGPVPQILAGIEIASAGNVDVQADWSLNEWRFNGLPGLLTIRAGGDLTFNGSLSDGFTAADPLLLTERDASWSYRLAAGADLTSADPLAVRAVSELSPTDGGSLRIAAGSLPTRPNQSPGFRMIRTGTGSIDIAAARNVELGNRASVIYTAGVAHDGVSFAGRLGELGGRLYPDRGGDISIAAGADVVGAATNQLITDWLWRVGRDNENPENSFAPAWTVNFGQFMQNVGALGGGNVTVSAGRDVRDLSAVAPTIGRQVGGRTLPQSQLEITGGGNVAIRASRNVEGGVVYSGRGDIDVTAGDGIVASNTSSLGLIAALGDAQAHLSSRGDLLLAASMNPTLLPQGSSQTGAAANRSYFSTYTEASSLSVFSTSGDVVLRNNAEDIATYYGTLLGTTPIASTVYAPSASVIATRGDVTVEDSFGVYPAHNGGLSLFAHGDADFSRGEIVTEVVVSDADPARLPSLTAPQRSDAVLLSAFGPGNRAYPIPENNLNFRAAIPERLRQGRTDYEPSRVVAVTGDVRVNGNSGLYFGEPARISAGRDISGLSATIQNLEERDVSSITAGRDITYPRNRDSSGGIERNEARIDIDGPGTLEVRAGRHLDLQTSGGISSWGDSRNTALPASGADISVQAGTAARAPAYEAFTERYLSSSRFAEEFAQAAAQYRTQLVDYMREHGLASGRYDDALVAFKALPASEKAPLLETILFSELRASGKAAAAAGAGQGDFTRGFTALTTFYPGANPDLENGEANAYAGDLRLYFSKIYTMDDGDIRLLAPGGEINAGLASPPTAFNLNKSAADLGIVAQRAGNVSALSFYDFLVNESRVFAADGGDILVWATQGDIDAGRGAKTAISAPPPQVSFDPTTGAPIIVFPPALAGSGIQTLASTEGRKPGNVDLFAPRGVVNAGDAGIVAGNLTIAATAVLGADNIQVSGVSVGVPVDAGGLGASLASVSSVGSSATAAATTTVEGARDEEQPASLAETALSWLEVFVVGLGEDNCRQDDVDCLKRQQ